jgi:hypothetical protein
MLCIYNFLDLAYEGFHGHGLTIIHDWMVRCKTCRLQVRSTWVGGEQELEPDDTLVGGECNIALPIRYGSIDVRLDR